jgi:hypothetical protein
MRTLASQRPVFHSEFDFQFALSKVMEQAGVSRIRLERLVQLHGNPRFEIDVMGYLHRRTPIALELKYPKDRFVGTATSDGFTEDFYLPSSGAFDVDARNIWKDVSRIEELLAAEMIGAGAVITLSNYKFWDQRRHKQGTQAHDFRLWQNRETDANVVFAFPESAKWVRQEHSPVLLRHPYRCDWHHYSEPLGADFRYLVLAP